MIRLSSGLNEWQHKGKKFHVFRGAGSTRGAFFCRMLINTISSVRIRRMETTVISATLPAKLSANNDPGIMKNTTTK